MNKSLKKIWNVISTILVALVVLLALLLVGARVVGLQVFTVLSGSMEPTYHTGSLIYVKNVDPYTIEEGQPITFMLDENTIATHRVVGIVPDEEDPTVIRFRWDYDRLKIAPCRQFGSTRTDDLVIAAHNAHDADISAAAALTAGDVAVIGRKAGGKDVIDLRGRAVKIFRQLIAANLHLVILLFQHQRLDELLDAVAQYGHQLHLTFSVFDFL